MEDVRYPQDIESRRAQVVPTLNPAQIEVARRFGGEPERFAPGEVMIPLDGRNRCFIILEGSIDLIRRDGLGNESRIVVFEPGQFSGETNLLSNRTAIGEGRAGASGCLAIPFTAPEVRGLIIGHAEIGEIVMRAFILRRVALLAAGAATTVIVGPATNHDVLRLQSFFARHGYPNTLLEPNADDTAQSIAARFGVQEHDLPIVVCQDGTLLRNPSDTEVAWRVGITSELATNTLFDVAVIGAGPAGLATAVYAASEGLSVLILESRVFGGQAGASARIENYLGFPTGISGQALMGRAFHQAAKFGADVVMPMAVTRLRCNRPTRSLATAAEIEVSTGATVRARTAVIASGVRYKRPEIARFDEFEGHGISYWASPVEAKACANQEVALIGGGNSAGQAAVFLASKASRVHLLVRRNLAATMSRYLIERIRAQANIEVHEGCEIVRLDGTPKTGLAGIAWRNRGTDAQGEKPIRHLFSFIGADPNTEWLKGCDIATDDKGFVLTGKAGDALSLETNIPGIFAVGDVRAGSTKRVAAAVGEGAAVVGQLHAVLRSDDERPDRDARGP